MAGVGITLIKARWGGEKLCGQMENVSARVSEGAGMTQALIGIKGVRRSKAFGSSVKSNFASEVAAATLTNGQRGEMTALSVFFFSPFSYYRWKDKPSWLGGGVITEQINKAEKVAYWRAVSRRAGSGSLPL